MTTVTWTQDANLNYEVSSPEHLKQIMHKGALYTDAGSFPTDYWADGTNYIQTADIDLLGDSTDIKPIGTWASVCRSEYNGNFLEISNWSYVDPEFGNVNDCEIYAGLFGNTYGNLQNIRLRGIFTLRGFKGSAGLLCGRSLGPVSNIICDFSDGSEIVHDQQVDHVSAVVGSSRSVTNVILRGQVDFVQGATKPSYSGGVIAKTSYPCELLQNFATFPSGITSTKASGGIVGTFTTTSVSDTTRVVKNSINAMKGDISSDEHAGGVIGRVYAVNEALWDSLINSMTGNITGADSAGGVVGQVQGYDVSSNRTPHYVNRLVNYMSGDISSSSGVAGGLVGEFIPRSVNTMTSSINAMNGNVAYSVAVLNTSATVVATVDTSFGMTFTFNPFSTTSPPAGFLTNPTFSALPYFEIPGIDSFVFANLAGNSSYSAYTHLTLHKGDVSTPFYVGFDLEDTNTTTYLTYANLPNKTVFADDTLTILAVGNEASAYDYTGLTLIFDGSPPPPLALVARSVNIPVVFQEVAGAVGYNVTYEGPTGGEVTAFSGVTTLEHNITGLDPDTQYIIKLYADTGTGYELTEELTTTTLANVAANYDITDFQQEGVINLANLPETTISSINAVINDLFSTGDTVTVSVKNKGKFNTSFIKLGETLSIKELDGVLLPFVEASGTGQNVNVVLSDGSTTVTIGYDDTVDSITIGGVVYYPGDSFILDGQKVTVVEY